MGNKVITLVYSEIKEEDEDTVVGWDKATVEYMTSHMSAIKNKIKKQCNNFQRRVSMTDIEEVTSELGIYLHDHDDYNIAKAKDRSKSGNIIPLEGYINDCIKNCVMRHCTTEHELNKHTTPNYITGEDEEEINIFDNIAKEYTSLENVECDLDAFCKCNEPNRYRFGNDIFLIMYLGLLGERNNKQDKVQDIYRTLGITKKELLEIRENAKQLMLIFADEIIATGIEKAVQVLKKYVYGADIIEKTVAS